MKNKKEFKRLMGLLGEHHERSISIALYEVYWIALSKYADDVCIDALNRCFVNCKYFPKIYDVINAIESCKPDVIDTAQTQINEVMAQIRNIGSWGTPVFKDPITKHLLSSRWTWKSICAMTEDENKWWAKEFIEAYQSCDRMDQKQIECGSPRLKLLAGGIGG